MKKYIKPTLLVFVLAVAILGMLIASKSNKSVSKAADNAGQGESLTQVDKNKLIMREFDKIWNELIAANASKFKGLSQNEINFRLTGLVVSQVMKKLKVTNSEVTAALDQAK